MNTILSCEPPPRRYSRLLRFGAVAAAFWLCAAAVVSNDESPSLTPLPESPQPLREELDKVRKESSQLKEENTRLQEEIVILRRENQQLRRMLAERLESKATNTVARAATEAGEATDAAAIEAGLTHWLSTLSGKRHNSKCRYYGKTDGQHCGPDEGTACKICGG